MQKPETPDIESTMKKFNDLFGRLNPMLEAIEKMNDMGIPVGELMKAKMNGEVPSPTISFPEKEEVQEQVEKVDTDHRYDLSQGLHIPQKQFGESKAYSNKSLELYTLIAEMLTDGDYVDYDEDCHELVFEMGGKKWNFCLNTECCQVKVLSVVFRSLHDLMEGGALIYNPKG